MRPVFFYISGHGFGHASRQIEILNALGQLDPVPPVTIRTTAARWLFDRTLRTPATILGGGTDTGAVQIDSLRLEVDATVREAADFHDGLDERAAGEAALLGASDAALVVTDAPPLACAAARRAGIPSVVVGNFTWDWIYEGYAPHPDLTRLLPRLREAYALADAAWRMPLHGGFATIADVRDVPFVARHATASRDDTRRRLGLPQDRPLILVSFGGFGLDRLDVARLDCLDRYAVVVPHRGPAAALPRGILPLDEDRLYADGLRYEDLVAAVDVVLTKPGYGIISECIANGTALLYTSRGRFAEYDVMVERMPRYLRTAYISQDDLFAGAWRAPLEAIEAQAEPPRPRTDGAAVVARLIHDRLTAADPRPGAAPG